MNLACCFLVDAGNSRIKVSSLEEPAKVLFNTDNAQELSIWLTEQHATEVWLASVRKDAVADYITRALTSETCKVHVIETQHTAFGLQNSYQDVSTMGVDRWLAMLAVTELTPLPLAVMMFGTAITCDLVVDGQHRGGWIAPGRELMINALTQNTDRVFSDSQPIEQFGLGTSTPECVGFGCFAAAQGLIAVISDHMATTYSDYKIFLTGGDQQVIHASKHSAISSVDNLVLLGLARYAKRANLGEK